MPDPFDEIRWKIRWSEQHFEVLEKKAVDFLETQFYQTRSDVDRKNRLVVRVTHVNPMPPELSLLIGDTAHNLRSALDHLIWLFARPRTERRERRVQFPIADHKNDFRSQREYMMPGVPRRVRALVERLQPYHRRKWPKTALLGRIKEIDNWDKHRALATAATQVEGTPVKITTTGIATIIQERTFRGRLKSGTPLARLQMTKGLEKEVVTVNAKPTLIPVFDDGMPKEIRGRPVIETLREAGHFLRHEVLPLFRPFLR